MIHEVRERFNRDFTEAKYHNFIADINASFNHTLPFRLSETPLFIPNLLKERLVDACHKINEVICRPDFKALTQNAISHPSLFVPGEDYHTRFLQMDFGVCLDINGDPFPKLIEVQGFPSVYFFQDHLAKMYAKHFNIPDTLSVYVQKEMRSAQYLARLERIIVGDEDPRQVVMLEIEPEKQATYIDFLCTEREIGIKILCISKLIKRDTKLYYKDEAGKEIHIKRIYNRVIFDELDQRSDLERSFNFTDEVDVEWVGHPNWFYRISKWAMPLFKNEYVPKCHYLNELDSYPDDLDNYVLKPLFSFAGSGVIIDVTKNDLDKIKDPENFILQEKVNYEPVIKSPEDPVKCEIRMLMLWDKDEPTAEIVNNLVRMSKGKMIGTKYNKDKTWVGGSVGFFE